MSDSDELHGDVIAQIRSTSTLRSWQTDRHANYRL